MYFNCYHTLATIYSLFWWSLNNSKQKMFNSRKSVTWSAVPDAPMLVYVGMRWWEGQRPRRGRWPMIPHRAIFSSFRSLSVWRPNLLTNEPGQMKVWETYFGRSDLGSYQAGFRAGEAKFWIWEAWLGVWKAYIGVWQALFWIWGLLWDLRGLIWRLRGPI